METSFKKEDDASTIATHSRPTTKIAKVHGHMIGLNTSDVILLGGLKEMSGGILKPSVIKSPLMWMIYLLRSHTTSS